MMKNNKNKNKIILDLCGGTGSWSKPYKDAGYNVHLITLPTWDVTAFRIEKHYLYFEGKITTFRIPIDMIYGVLCAPPCTKFSKADWRKSRSERDFKEGMRCVKACMEIIWGIQEQGAPLEFWAMENPLGYLYNFMGIPAFFFQPWQFGEKGILATKRTALWGYFEKPKKTVLTRTIPYVKTHSKNRDEKSFAIEISRQWGNTSKEDRARTPEKFAKAFYKANK